MTSGRREETSKIDKYNLGDVVVGLKSMGLSYQEICDDIKINYTIILNKSNLTNFYNWVGEPEHIDTKNHKCSTLTEVNYRVKNEIYAIRKDIKREFENIGIKIDEAEMIPIHRGNLKKALSVYEKKLIKNIDDLDVMIVDVMSSVNKSTHNPSTLLFDVSNQLYPQCMRMVSAYASQLDEKMESKDTDNIET